MSLVSVSWTQYQKPTFLGAKISSDSNNSDESRLWVWAGCKDGKQEQKHEAEEHDNDDPITEAPCTGVHINSCLYIQD